MSTSQTVLAYINGLKWPVVAAGAIACFHKPISAILDRISTARRGAISGPAGTGVSWDDTLKEVDAAVEKAMAESVVNREADSGDDSATRRPEPPVSISRDVDPTPIIIDQVPYWPGLTDLAHVSPQAAVVMSFTQIEQALRVNANQRDGITRAGSMGAMMLARQISLPADVQMGLRQLSHLRNEVIHHNAEPNESMALEYVATAERLYDFIRAYSAVRGMEDDDPPPEPVR